MLHMWDIDPEADSAECPVCGREDLRPNAGGEGGVEAASIVPKKD